MLCPFHLGEVERFESVAIRIGGTDREMRQFACPDCGVAIPRLYVDEYQSYRPLLLSVVGFREHGKSLFIAALIHILRGPQLARAWPRFSSITLNDDTFTNVYANLKDLNSGVLPPGTEMVDFPTPGLLRIEPAPFHPGRTLLWYDTGGETFGSPTKILPYASFISKAPSVLFLVSLRELEDPSIELARLLETYILGSSQIGNAKNSQHLIVVYTKAEEIRQLEASRWSDIAEYAKSGIEDDPPRSSQYGLTLDRISLRIAEFTDEELRATSFLNAARAWFASVEFCIVSALGAAPHDKRLNGPLAPRRVIDPLIWLMSKDKPPAPSARTASARTRPQWGDTTSWPSS